MRLSLYPVMLAAACLSALAPALARNVWDINHGMSNPPEDPRFKPGGIYSGYVRAVTGADFWKGQLNRRVPVGTVLTAILEDNLSSAKNKAGDSFTLTLQDGFQLNGNVLIPPNSKIVGSITAVTSAKKMRNGNPGRMTISLQSLVFPDGRHMPIYAMVDGNPNHAFKKAPKVHQLGVSFSDYGQALTSMATSFITGPGVFMNRLNRGLDFKMDKGDALPIRLNRSLDIPYQAPLLASPPASGTSDSSSIPYPPGSPAHASANALDPAAPIQMPGAPAAGGGSVTAHKPASADPNYVFNQPVKPLNIPDMDDPF